MFNSNHLHWISAGRQFPRKNKTQWISVSSRISSRLESSKNHLRLFFCLILTCACSNSVNNENISFDCRVLMEDRLFLHQRQLRPQRQHPVRQCRGKLISHKPVCRSATDLLVWAEVQVQYHPYRRVRLQQRHQHRRQHQLHCHHQAYHQCRYVHRHYITVIFYYSFGTLRHSH